MTKRAIIVRDEDGQRYSLRSRAMGRCFLVAILTVAVGFAAWGLGADVRTAVGTAGLTVIASIVSLAFVKEGESAGKAGKAGAA